MQIKELDDHVPTLNLMRKFVFYFYYFKIKPILNLPAFMCSRSTMKMVADVGLVPLLLTSCTFSILTNFIPVQHMI